MSRTLERNPQFCIRKKIFTHSNDIHLDTPYFCESNTNLPGALLHPNSSSTLTLRTKNVSRTLAHTLAFEAQVADLKARLSEVEEVLLALKWDMRLAELEASVLAREVKAVEIEAKRLRWPKKRGREGNMTEEEEQRGRRRVIRVLEGIKGDKKSGEPDVREEGGGEEEHEREGGGEVKRALEAVKKLKERV
jgi:hypothetical protein